MSVPRPARPWSHLDETVTKVTARDAAQSGFVRKVQLHIHWHETTSIIRPYE